MHNTPVAHTVQQEVHNRGYVPHVENMSLQVITYRLYDSLPTKVVEDMKLHLAIKEKTENDKKKLADLRKKIDQFEDAGYGQCFLGNPLVAATVKENILHFDGVRYNLMSCCIMPNHVHVLIKVNDGYTLSEIMHGWRSYTAHQCNKLLHRNGDFWMNEYFDRYIRDKRHLQNALNYIANNPIKAGLARTPEEWPWYFTGTQGRNEPESEGGPWSAGDSPAKGKFSQASRLRSQGQNRSVKPTPGATVPSAKGSRVGPTPMSRLS